MLDGLNTKLYMKKYNKWLLAQGVGIDLSSGGAKYIHHTVLLDGIDYSLIEIGSDSVISVGSVVLTHDFSVEAGMRAIGKRDDKNEAHYLKKVIIGQNCFIGARCVILGGTKLGNNCIVGAGTVLPGKEYPENSIIVGNPGRIIGNTIDWAQKKFEQNDFKRGCYN